MILVFLLLGLIIITSLVTCIILLSNIKIKITKLYIFYNSGKFKIEFMSKLGLYVYNKIKIYENVIENEKIKKLYQSGNFDIKKIKDNKEINRKVINALKESKFVIEGVSLKGYIGTENAAFTAYITAFINTIIPIIISKKINNYKEQKYNYQIDTVYINQNIVNLECNCIISIKIVHIINILYIYLRKGRVKKNERTSNRRTYAYSHE